MQKKMKLLSVLVAAFLMLAAFAGCNNTPSGDTKTGVGNPNKGDSLAYDEALKINAGENITIKFWVPDEKPIIDICEKYMAAYKAVHANVTFDFDHSRSWDDYWAQVPLEIAAGTGPDIFWMHNAYDATVKSVLAAMPADVFPEAAMKKDFRQVDAHKIDGKYYYIDTGLMSSIVIYNKPLWEAAGLTEADEPTTWDGLLQVAKKLTQYDDAGNILVNGFSYNGGTAFMNLVIAMNYQKGVFTYAADGKSSQLNNETTIANMDYLKSWYEVEKVGAPAETDTFTELASGKTAMICEWTWVPANISDFEIGMFPTPTFDGVANSPAVDRNNGECTPVVSNKATAAAQAVAFDFVKYLISGNDFLRDFALSNGVFPSKYALDNDPAITGNETLKTLSETVKKTLWVGPVPSQIENAIAEAQGAYLFEGTSAADALAKCDADIKAEIADTGFVPLERTYADASKFTK